ncbi:hypothetical protein CH76_06715 [Lysinibacillus sp. BF-4]|uniref:DMT family transporter n=1 Tax=Lysinibacillus sp. BF-4 TaxID=1473546 RepID=UPI00050521CB|nr:multidrug efflux SMR transporter [Lysinibacillus sp. BF-4]KFL43425.1 hypothetical protein CH76_06715 [Lysinibacillus sp. BF-4]
MKGFALLSVAIVTEIIATLALKFSNGFTVLAPSLVVIAGYLTAFYFLSLTLRHMALSVAYAIWSGVGTAATVIIGVLLFNDPFTVTIALGLLLIILGVILLNQDGPPASTS